MSNEQLRTFRRNRARTWIFRKSWARYLLEMDDRTAGQLIKMICRYERGQIVDPEDLKDPETILTSEIIMDDLDDMDQAFLDKLARDPDTSRTKQADNSKNGAA